MKSVFSLFAAGMLAVIVGCGPDTSGLPQTYVAEGVVTLDGTPVPGATVIALPEGQGTDGGNAVTDDEGKFSLRAFEQKPGIIPGEYRITVRKTVVQQADTGAEIGTVSVEYGVPKVYSGGGTTPLRLSMPAEDKTDITFELKSK